MVPSNDATRLLRVSMLNNAERTKWKPINGVKDIAAPMAKPEAML